MMLFTPDFVRQAPAERLRIREAIEWLEDAMREADEQVEIEPVHRFADGLYAREVFLPAGTVAVGHIHGKEHICIVSQGRVRLLTEQGGAREVAAPSCFVVPVGTKNLVLALEDTVWTTIHATQARDVAAIEREVLLQEYPALEGERE